MFPSWFAFLKVKVTEEFSEHSEADELVKVLKPKFDDLQRSFGARMCALTPSPTPISPCATAAAAAAAAAPRAVPPRLHMSAGRNSSPGKMTR